MRPAFAVVVAAPFLIAAAAPGDTPAELLRLGWRKVVWQGIPPPTFSATPGGVRVQGQAQAAFVFRPLAAPQPGPSSGPATCLAWRWRVDAGPPPTDLTRRGGDDRAITLTVGFSGFGPDAGMAARAQLAIAQAVAGDHRLPRSMLSYVWGGTGREGAGGPRGFFVNPWSSALSRVRILRPADAPRGQWVEERVDLTADWRTAFGDAAVPALQEVAVGTDVDDTRSAIDARIENIRLVPCG
jgi:hypothetical protein